MEYKSVQPHTQSEAAVAFAQGTSEQISDALLGITYYMEDWRWVQSACLTLLDNSDDNVQWIAIICLGHLATFHGTLDLAVVLPALQAHTSNSRLASGLYTALGDIALHVKDTSYFGENWDKLPPRMKEALVANRIFDSRGKRITKRKFISYLRNIVKRC
jgi:hypothetical protein